MKTLKSILMSVTGGVVINSLCTMAHLPLWYLYVGVISWSLLSSILVEKV